MTPAVPTPAEFLPLVDAARFEFVHASLEARQAKASFDAVLEMLEPQLAPLRRAQADARDRLAAAEAVLKDVAERVAVKLQDDASLAPDLYAIKHRRSTTITATDATVLEWLRANMPALILPPTFDPEQVADTVAQLPATVQPEWLVQTDTVHAQIQRAKVEALLVRHRADAIELETAAPAPVGPPSFDDSAPLPWD